jgi:hypothetical protein
MNAIRVKHVRDFKGEDVVLLAMDGAGLATFLAAVTQAERRGSGRLLRARRVHDFVIAAGAADIELADDRVLWRLDRAIAVEMIAALTGLGDNARPCHQFVEGMASPAPTLVLSLDQYISPSWLTAGKEPMFGDDEPD